MTPTSSPAKPVLLTTATAALAAAALHRYLGGSQARHLRLGGSQARHLHLGGSQARHLDDAKSLTRWAARHGTASLAIRAADLVGEPFGRLCSAELRADPYAYYDELRAAGDIVAGRFACVTARYELCAELVRDPRFLSGFPDETLPGPLQAALRWAYDPAVLSGMDRPSMLVSNGEEHARFRRLVTKAFTARAVGAMRDRTEEIAEELLGGLEQRARAGDDRADLVREYGELLPVLVIASILGVPREMRDTFLAWTHQIAPLTDVGLSYAGFRRAEAAMRELNAWMLGHLASLRREPGEDLLSRIVVASEEERAAGGPGLSETDLMITATLMLGAGFETTVNLIGNGVRLLLAHPTQLGALRTAADWANAVEEILRYDSAVQNTYRYPAEDTDVRGVRVRRGQFVVVLLAAANRDPDVFADPHAFDVTRANAREHLSFSLGPHFCVGAALARMEGEVALRRLFERFPALVEAGEPTRRPTRALRGYAAMPVRLGTPQKPRPRIVAPRSVPA